MALKATQQLCQRPRVQEVGIDAIYQGILEYHATTCRFHPVAASGHYVLNGVTFGDGHDLKAHLVAGRVQRNGEGNGQLFFRQTPHFGHQAAGTDRNMTRADAHAFGQTD